MITLAKNKLHRFPSGKRSLIHGSRPFVLYLLYDILFTLGLLLYLPISFWRKKMTISALKEKLGFIPSKRLIKESIWIHVVSVGEANLIENFVKKLRQIHSYPLVISTTTLTGNAIARRKYSSFAKVIFFPFDLSLILIRVLKIINPKIFIAVETEIWPNLFTHLRKKNIPIMLINGRISDSAYKRYKAVKPLLKGILNKCCYIGAQPPQYEKRFLCLGAKRNIVNVSGNMKFESISIDDDTLQRVKKEYLPILKKEGDPLIIAGSTHHPEEEIIIDIYKNLLKLESKITLVIAPRHPQRVPSVEKLLQTNGFSPMRISKAAKSSNRSNNVFILDTVGELIYFYGIADICFVGGSLSGNGGHNILEPLYFQKPTLFGPSMDNFRDIEKVVLQKNAGLKVKTPEELQERLLQLLRDCTLRKALEKRSKEVFENEQKGLQHSLDIIGQCLGKPPSRD